jgi:hypothetical protein
MLGIDVCQTGVGCASHPGEPHYWPRGNVTKNETFKERFDSMMDFVERTYEVWSSMSFLPNQLHIIHDSLIHQNDKFKLMYWTIMIVGIKLFGRVKEVLNLKVEDLDQGMFVVTEEDVEALVAVMNGKCDDKDVWLVLWDDKDCTDFSLTRALMIWLAMSGIKSGYLFPPAAELTSTRKHQKNPFHMKHSLMSSRISALVSSAWILPVRSIRT